MVQKINTTYMANIGSEHTIIEAKVDEPTKKVAIKAMSEKRESMNFKDLSTYDINEIIEVLIDVNKAVEAPLTINPISIVRPTDLNSYDGSISLLVRGGIAPYKYSWNIGETTPSISELGTGTYTVTVTDYFDTETTYTIELTAINP